MSVFLLASPILLFLLSAVVCQENCLSTDPITGEFCHSNNDNDCINDKVTVYEKTQTKDGVECQAWDEQVPHKHFTKDPPSDNNCRNLDGKMGPWCFTTDRNQKWDFCYPICYQPFTSKCLSLDPISNSSCMKPKNYDCKNDATSTYPKMTTAGGVECQKWTSQSPHEHRVADMPDDNRCRNPDGELGPWCFTTDPDLRWDYCYPVCSSSRRTAGCLGSGRVTGETCMLTQSEACKNESIKYDRRSTAGAVECQYWNAKTPHEHRYSYVGTDNYCRNPDGELGPWCYTVDPEKRWDYCYPSCTATDTTGAKLQEFGNGALVIDQGALGYYWAGPDGVCRFRCFDCTGWTIFDGTCDHVITAGNESVWNLKSDGELQFRTGVRKSQGKGSAWDNVETPKREVANDISCGLDDSLWLATQSGKLYKRIGTIYNKKGHGWQQRHQDVQYVSVGQSGIWAAGKTGVFYLNGTFGGFGDGTNWVQVERKPAEFIASGRDVVYVVDPSGFLWARKGLSAQVPGGLAWEQLGTGFHSVTTDPDGSVLAVKTDNTAYFEPGKFKNCRAQAIEIIDKTAKAERDGVVIIGIGTAATCAKGQRTLTLQATSIQETKISISTEDDVPLANKILVSDGIKGKAVAKLTQETAKVWVSRETNKKEQHLLSSMDFEGPGAAMVMGWVNKYKTDRKNVAALYHMFCEGTTYSKPGTIQLKSTSFGRAHFTDVAYQFANNSCTPKALRCILLVDGTQAYIDPIVTENSFDKCFQNGVGYPVLRRRR